MTIPRRLPVFHLDRCLRLPRLSLGRIGFIHGKKILLGVRSLRPSTDAMNVDIRLNLFSLDTLVFDFVLLVLVNEILSE